MPGKLAVYGWRGVNVDKNAVQLEDSELTKAQNATHDPLGAQGGMRKRAGLTKVNSVAAAGAVRGAIGVPIVKPSTRRLLAGQWTGTTGAWNTSTDAWATGVTTGGPDGYAATATPRIPANVWTNMADVDSRQRAFAGRPGVVYKNRFYYAGNDYTVGTTPPTIRVWDGTIDYVLTTLPPRDSVQMSAILSMIAANGRIYLTAYDAGSSSGVTVTGRVFEVDPDSGATLQLGSRFPFGSGNSNTMPYTLAWYQGRLWTRTGKGLSVTEAVANTYFLRPNIDDDWTLDVLTSGTPGLTPGTAVFQGRLYFSAMANSGTAATVLVRPILGGAANVSKTAAVGDATPNITTFGAYNHFGAMVVFNSNLYVSYYNRVGTGLTGERIARIYKYDGTSWTVVFNPAADSDDAIPYSAAFIDDGNLYFVSAPAYDSATNLNRMQKTANGTSWTAITSTQLTNNSIGTLGVLIS